MLVVDRQLQRHFLKKTLPITAPKKTWGVRWFPKGSFFVAIFVTGRQESASKSPTFLSCKALACIVKRP